MKQQDRACSLCALVADDHRISREFTACALSEAGFHVMQASSAKQAVDLALARLPALMVLDWRLGDGSGGDVARAIRNEWPPGIRLPRLVLLTGETPCPAGDGTMAPWSEAEFDHVLQKPFRTAELLDRVNLSVPPGVRESKPRPSGLIRSVRAELLEAMPRMERSLLRGHLPPVSRQAHRLVASSGMCDAGDLESALRELERACQAPADAATTADCWTRVRNEANRFLATGTPAD